MKSVYLFLSLLIATASLGAEETEPTDFPVVGAIYYFEGPPGQNMGGFVGRVLAVSKTNSSWIQVLPTLAKTRDTYEGRTLLAEPFTTKTGSPFWLNIALRASAYFVPEFSDKTKIPAPAK